MNALPGYQTLQMVTLQPKRQKKHHNKVRTGCHTCKRRHFKCDEKKPKCLACTNRGYICEGYSSPRNQDSQQPITRESVTRDLWNFFPGARDKIAFKFFLEVTVSWFSTSQDCKQFFNPLLLQVLHHEPVVKHMVLAVGSAHRLNWDETCDPPSEESFFIHHYDKALNILNSNPEIDVSLVLICCLLFCMLETFRRRQEVFLSHMVSGTKILWEMERLRNYSSTSRERIRVYIAPMIIKLAQNTKEVQEYALMTRKDSSSLEFGSLHDAGKLPIPRRRPQPCYGFGPHEAIVRF